MVVQEGVANWIAVVVIGRAGPIWDAQPPTPEMTRRMMTMPYDEYKELSEDERYLVDYAAMYVASQIVRFDGATMARRPARWFSIDR